MYRSAGPAVFSASTAQPRDGLVLLVKTRLDSRLILSAWQSSMVVMATAGIVRGKSV